MLEAISGFLDLLEKHGILLFPYFLGFAALMLSFVYRDAELIKRHGLQIISIAIVLPMILFAANKEWNNVVALLGVIIGYVFGIQKQDYLREKS